MSLRTNLYKQIEARKGEVFTYQELENYCRVWGYKISNAERRLREMAGVEGVRNRKNCITGYRLITEQSKLF